MTIVHGHRDGDRFVDRRGRELVHERFSLHNDPNTIYLSGRDERSERIKEGVCQYTLHWDERMAIRELVVACANIMRGSVLDHDAFCVVFHGRRNNYASLPDWDFEAQQEPVFRSMLAMLATEQGCVHFGRCYTALDSWANDAMRARRAAIAAARQVLGESGFFVCTCLAVSLLLWICWEYRDIWMQFSLTQFTSSQFFIVLIAPVVEELAMEAASWYIDQTAVRVVWVILHGGNSIGSLLSAGASVIVFRWLGARGLRKRLVGHIMWNFLVVVLSSSWFVPFYAPTMVYIARTAMESCVHTSFQDGVGILRWLGVAVSDIFEMLPQCYQAAVQQLTLVSEHCSLDEFYVARNLTSWIPPEFVSATVEMRLRLCSEVLRHAGVLVAPYTMLLGVLSSWIWMADRLSARCHKVHRAYCCGLQMQHRRVKGFKTVLQSSGRQGPCHVSPFYQIGPVLPGHVPLCPASCQHNMINAVLKRLLVTGCESGMVSDVEFDQVLAGVDSTKLSWDWEGFISNKPSKVVVRARRGLASLLAKGAAIVGDQLELRSAEVDVAASLFVKREFYDYTPDVDKPAKFRSIVNCSDEVLAYLGPYMHSLDEKMRLLDGMVKFYASSQLSGKFLELQALARSMGQDVFASDQSQYDAHQTKPHLLLQHRMFKRFGMPRAVVDFLGHYDIEWSAVYFETAQHRRGNSLRFSSKIGVRKSGDPHTSCGNNLYHWFLIRLCAYRLTKSVNTAHFLINGDDFLGFVEKCSFRQLAAEMAALGMEVVRGDHYEFCGGYFCGKQAIFVRDPNRSLPKFGWNVSDGSVALMRATAICQSYISAANPILSALIARVLELTSGTQPQELSLAQQEDISYALAHSGCLRSGVAEQFTTVVPWDVRIEFCDLFGITPALQVQFEQEISQMQLLDEMPRLLGKLV